MQIEISNAEISLIYFPIFSLRQFDSAQKKINNHLNE